jgi:hypothetical protein
VLGELVQALVPALLHAIERCGHFGRRFDDDCLQREFRLAAQFGKRDGVERFERGTSLTSSIKSPKRDDMSKSPS